MNKGFTLIELLVVVLIIGILAAIALPQYTKAVEKSRAAEAMQVLGDLATAESLYYMANNAYTTNLASLDMEFPGASGNTITGKSYTIGVSVLSGGNFSATASRAGGTYDGQTITIGLDNKGKITRGATGSDLPGIIGATWKN